MKLSITCLNLKSGAYHSFLLCCLFLGLSDAMLLAQNPDQSGQASTIGKEFSTLYDDYLSIDNNIRMQAYSSLKQRNLSDEEIIFLAGQMTRFDLRDHYIEGLKQILAPIPVEKRTILFRFYQTLPLDKPGKFTLLLASLPRARPPYDGIDFLLNELKSSSELSRLRIMKALKLSPVVSFDYIRSLFLSDHPQNQADAMQIMQTHSFFHVEILETLYNRITKQITADSEGSLSDQSIRLLKMTIDKNVSGAYPFIREKIKGASKADRLMLVNLITGVGGSSFGLFKQIADMADPSLHPSVAERKVASLWLRKSTIPSTWTPDQKRFAIERASSGTAALQDYVIKNLCDESDEIYKMILHRVQDHADLNLIVPCLLNLSLDKEKTKQLYPYIIEANILSQYKGDILKKDPLLAIELLKQRITHKDPSVRVEVIGLLKRVSYGDPQLIQLVISSLEFLIEDTDLEVASTALSSLLHRNPDAWKSETIKKKLVYWYKNKKLFNDEIARADTRKRQHLHLALRYLLKDNYFTEADIPYLLDLQKTSVNHDAARVLQTLPYETVLTEFKKRLTGDYVKDSVYYYSNPFNNKMEFTFNLIDEGKYSRDYYLQVLVRMMILPKVSDDIDVIKNRLQRYPDDLYALFAATMFNDHYYPKAVAEEQWLRLSREDDIILRSLGLFNLYRNDQYNRSRAIKAEELEYLYYLDRFSISSISFQHFLFYNKEIYAPEMVKKNLSLLSHPEPAVRHGAAMALYHTAGVSLLTKNSIKLSRENITALFQLLKTENMVTRGYAILLLYRYKSQIPGWDSRKYYTQLHYGTNTLNEGVLGEFEEVYDDYPELKVPMLKACLITESKGMYYCLYKLMDHQGDLSEAIEPLKKIAFQPGSNKTLAMGVLCKAAPANKEALEPFFLKVLAPTENLYQDQKEISDKASLLACLASLEKNQFSLAQPLSALYQSLQKDFKYDKNRYYPYGSVTLADLRMQTAYAIIKHSENEDLIKKNIAYLWNHTQWPIQSVAFWQAVKKYPDALN